MFGFSLLVVCLFIGMIESQPDPTTCRHVTVDPSTGSIITFSQLYLIRPLDNDIDFQVTDSTNERFVYDFRICENIVTSCGSNGATPVCQTETTSGNTYSLGQLPTQFILDYPSLDKSRGVLIEYSNGTSCTSGARRRILITIECDPNIQGPLSTVSANHQSADPCEYELYAKSPYACPDVADNVCSGVVGCRGCTAYVGCGWCAAQQKCVRGDMNGPIDGTLCLGSKSYFYGSDSGCPECNTINGCSECTASPDCKWCEDGGCIPYYERECVDVGCKCPACSSSQYCPPDGGDCKSLPNEAGLFVGGMFLGFAVVGIAWGGYVFYQRKGTEYQAMA